MRNLKTVVVVAVISMLVSACGGATGGDDPGTTIPESPTTTGAPATTAAPPTSSPSGGGLGGLPTACLDASQAMAAAFSAYSQAFTGATPGFEDLAGQLEAMADAAPAEIKSDLEVIASELGRFFEAFAEIGLVVGATPTPEQIERLDALSESYDEDAVDEASANVEAWFEDHCGG